MLIAILLLCLLNLAGIGWIAWRQHQRGAQAPAVAPPDATPRAMLARVTSTKTGRELLRQRLAARMADLETGA